MIKSETSLPPSPFRSPKEREEERSLKREAVLRAAVRMFNERGFAATSLDDVAASLGVSKPVIYHYLGNKDQVLFECVRLGLDQLRAAAEAAEALPGTGLDRLKAFLRRYAEINMSEFGMCVVRTGDHELSAPSRKRFRELKSEIDRAMRALIKQGVADRSLVVGDARITAFVLAGALNWPARWYDPEGPQTGAEIASMMVEALTTGLAPR